MARAENRRPWLAGGVVLLAGLITASDAASAWAVLERSSPGGLAAAGDWPRWWTTHAVHVSASHWLASGGVWLIAAAAVERISRGSLAWGWLAGAPAIAWLALAGDPEMGRYVGLSGLACAALVWLALELVNGGRAAGAGRWVGLAVLAAVAARIGWDLIGDGRGWLVVFDEAAGPVRVARYAHLAGAISGAAVWGGRVLGGRIDLKAWWRASARARLRDR